MRESLLSVMGGVLVLGLAFAAGCSADDEPAPVTVETVVAGDLSATDNIN